MSWKLLQPAPYQPILTDPAEIDSQYRYWRIRICYSVFLGYAVFYFTRKSFTFAMPFMQKALGYSKTELGLLATIFYIVYGISKFLSGVMSDRSNPRYFMAIGLMVTGVLNLWFGMASNLWFLAFLWAINGWFQAWGWPACCKQLNYWFSKSERGFWYSVCSTSHSLGGALIPLLAVYCAHQFGWRYALFVPGVIGIVMGLFLMNRLRDVPRTLGLPTIEAYKQERAANTSQDTQHSLLSVREILFKQVLNNKFVWMLAIAYFFIYVVRTAVNDWGFFYLTEVRQMSDILAVSGITWFEVGGFVGMITVGWSSDKIWKGNRIPVMLWCAAGLVLSILLLMYLPMQHAAVDLILFGLIGAFVFGPQMIVGLAAAEFVDKRAAATSNGFAGTLGYFGAAATGYPLGKVLESGLGWNGFFMVLLSSAVVIFVALLPAAVKLNVKLAPSADLKLMPSQK